MLDPLLVVELAPLFLSGAAALAGTGFLWLRGPRTGLTNSLALLLLFSGHLALVAAMVALPNDPGFAPRLLPLFQLATVGATLAFLIFLFEPHLDERRLDALLSSLIVGIVALIGLTLWRPELYWGTTGTFGPLYAATGIRTALFGLVAWLLAVRSLSRRRLFPQLARPSAYLLSAGFALVAVHDAATASVRSAVDGALHPSAAYLGAPLVAGLFVYLAWRRRFGPEGTAQRHAGQYLVVGLVPALLSVLVVDLVVVRLVPGARAALFLDLVLRHLWSAALPLATMFVLRAPGGILTSWTTRRSAVDRRSERAVEPSRPTMSVRETVSNVRQS